MRVLPAVRAIVLRPFARPACGPYTPRLRTAACTLLWATSLAACAPRTAVPVAPDAPVDTALVEEALAATAPRAPLHVTFDWSLQEPDGRFSGQGVIRMEPPDRARLDLFGPRGECYLTAVLDGEQLQIPASAQPLLPPPAFLWATLGVFREPARAQGTAA